MFTADLWTPVGTGEDAYAGFVGARCIHSNPRSWGRRMTASVARCGKVVLGLVLLAAGGSGPASGGACVDVPLVATQLPRQGPAGRRGGGTGAGLPHSTRFAGARLVLVSPSGEVRALSGEFDSACDPNVSFDAGRLLFAGRRAGGGRWRVWEMGLDGGDVRAVSPEHMDAWSPIYVSTLFTLDSPEPWLTTVFVGIEPARGGFGRPAVSSLYNIKLDGTELRRLTYTPHQNLDPFQMWDGRVIYSAESRPHEPGRTLGRQGIFAIHVEGADMELYGGRTGASIQQMPCATERGIVVFVELSSVSRENGGQLACVDERRPHVTYRRLSQDPLKSFLHPAPWRDNTVLVAQRDAGGEGTWGIVAMDIDRGQTHVVFDTPEYDEVQAVAVQPRRRPDGHSTVVEPRFRTGTFYGLNCSIADTMREAHLPPGSVKRVRFVEGVLESPGVTAGNEPHWPFPPRRLIGEAPVEADGSFNAEVPADTPLLLQTLDERGLALGTCGWIWVKPKETRGCIGCHEDPERIPENEYVLALRRPSTRLVLPPHQRRSVSFRGDVAPLLRRHCASAECHGGGNTPLHLPLASDSSAGAGIKESYAALMAPAEACVRPVSTAPLPGRYVDAGRARTSWLIWQLAGQNTARPWDDTAMDAPGGAREVRQMPPAGAGDALRAESVRTIIQWIDLGAPLDPVGGTAPAEAAAQDQAHPAAVGQSGT